MRLVVALTALVLAGPAIAQSGDCRGQARAAERELLLRDPQLSTSQRLQAETRLEHGESLCDSDPSRGSWELDKVRRDMLAEQPRLVAPSRERWSPGGVDRLD